MCTVSAVLQYGQRYRDDYWTQQNWPPFTALVKQAEEFDKITGQPDCVDPAKEAWMKRIEQRLEQIERAGLPVKFPIPPKRVKPTRSTRKK